jgi:voltage-gated potassium channel Kch
MGLAERAGTPGDAGEAPEAALALLGFYRDASSILHQFEIEAKAEEGRSLLRDVLVIDFNPEVLEELKRRGIRSLYGDVASMDTLHHAPLHGVRLIACTLTDSVLKGTTNARLLKQLRRLAPGALLVMASDTLKEALRLYEAGADFVFVPRIHSAHRMAEVLRTGLEDGLDVLRGEELEALRARDEVLA